MVQKFFCWELLTAGLVIGWLGIVESISSVVSNAIVLDNIDVYFDPTKFPDIDPAVIHRSEIYFELYELTLITMFFQRLSIYWVRILHSMLLICWLLEC